MSERKSWKGQRDCLRAAHAFRGRASTPVDAEICDLCDGLDTADAEIAALKTQMAGMVTLEQVEKVFAEWLQEDDASIASLIKTFGQEVNADLKRLGGSPFGASITHDSGAVPLFMDRLRQSTRTEAVKPAEWSVKYTAQQIWDAVHDHRKYILSIGRADDPEDLADEVLDLLAVRSRSTHTKKE